MTWELGPCTNRGCFRKVAPSVRYCCSACAAGDGKFDTEGYHSEACEKRLYERGQWSDAEMQMLRASHLLKRMNS